MTFIAAIFYLLIIGAIVLVINKLAPIDGKIKLVINVLVMIGVLCWLADATGILERGPRLPHR